MIDASKLARAGYTYLGRLYSEMDCQEFIERCLQDCGLKINLKGSNAWFRKMTWVGTPEECKQKFGKIPAGAFLFIWADDGGEEKRGYHDGKGNASHIGIYTATRQGAIHSSESKGCVMESRFAGKTIPNGGWNRIGLWNQIAYDTTVNYILNGKEKQSSGGEAVSYEATVTTSGGYLNLRASKNTKSDSLKQIPNGTVLMVTEEADGWCKTSYDGRSGWVSAEFLTKNGASEEQKKIDQALSEIERYIKAIQEQLEIIGSINGRG